MTTLLLSFLLSSEDNPRARNLGRCTRNKTQKPPRAGAGGGVQCREFSDFYLRDDSGSRARESDDDAEGNDLERARETDTAKRTMGNIITIFVFDASAWRDTHDWFELRLLESTRAALRDVHSGCSI